MALKQIAVKALGFRPESRSPYCGFLLNAKPAPGHAQPEFNSNNYDNDPDTPIHNDSTDGTAADKCLTGCEKEEKCGRRSDFA